MGELLDLEEKEFMKQLEKLTYPILYGNIIILVQAGKATMVTIEKKVKV